MISLQPHHTFGVIAHCREFTSITTVNQLQSLCQSDSAEAFVLGGGSNTLFVTNPKRVWIIDILGKEIIKQRENYVLLRVGAGEDWHSLVKYCVEEQLGGIENLALIPGKCGAAPIQNIGAYGVEIKDVLQSVSVVERATGYRKEFHKSELDLGYRDSLFKHKWKGRYIIDSIVIKLMKQGSHDIKTTYGAILQQLQDGGISNPLIADVFNAVVAIRSAKLPDPKVLGNGGSFFKNPIISVALYDELKAKYPTMLSYPISDTTVKVPAGWLIDQAGWKGKTVGNVGCYEKQALVIVNHGDATGQEVLAFSEMIQSSVEEKYGIILQREINLI